MDEKAPEQESPQPEPVVAERLARLEAVVHALVHGDYARAHEELGR